MLQNINIVRGFRSFFAFVPFNDCMAFRRLAEQHSMGEFKAATVAQAERFVRDAICEAHNYGWKEGIWFTEQVEKLSEYLQRHHEKHDLAKGWCSCKRRWSANDSTAFVGRVSEVSYLFDPGHSLGLDIATSTDGWTLERLELVDTSYEILRRRGKLRGFLRGMIMRQESRGGIHII